MALSNAIDQIMQTRVADIPVGKGAMFAASAALTNALAGLISKYIPSVAGSLTTLLTTGGVSWAVKNIEGIRDFLGENGSEVLAITAVQSGLDTTLGITGMVNQALSWVGVSPSPSLPIITGPSLGNPAPPPFVPSLYPAPLPPIPQVPLPRAALPPRALPLARPPVSVPPPRPSLGQPHLTPVGPESQTGRKIRMNLVGR